MELKSDLVTNIVLSSMFKMYGVKSLEELAGLLVNDEIFWFLTQSLGDASTGLVTTREVVEQLLSSRGH